MEDAGKEKNLFGIVIALCMLISGCVINVFSLEHIIKYDRDAGEIITLAQFLFIAIEGFIVNISWEGWVPRLSPRIIPLRVYFLMVLLFAFTSIVNNQVFSYHISVPLHSTFRAGGLIGNVLVGYFVFSHTYTFLEIISTLLVTLGITICTLASFSESAIEKAAQKNADFDITEFVFGISLLAGSQFLSALLGLIQEWSYNKYGKAPRENMFYSHALSLPLFIMLLPKLLRVLNRWIYSVNPSPIYLFTLLTVNVVSQYICIRGVFVVLSLTDSLTLTMALSFRKFVSLFISIYYFENDFTWVHWTGAILVLLGGQLYATRPSVPKKVK